MSTRPATPRPALPSPGPSFLLSLMFGVLSAAMNPTPMVWRNRVDAEGHAMVWPGGKPVMEIDHWASFWNGWLSHLPGLAAVFFFILGVVLAVRRNPPWSCGDRRGWGNVS